MSWLYKYFRIILGGTLPALEMHGADLKFASGSTVTAESGAAVTIASGATQTIAGTQTVTGTLAVNVTPTITGTIGAVATGASPLSYKIMTVGGSGATPIAWWTLYGAPSPVGPTPAHVGDILLDTKNGKLYVASATSAYTDWKIVTSA